MTRLSSGLPKGDANGLEAIARALVDNPHERHVVIAVVDCSRITTLTDTDEAVATVRVRRIERVHPEDRLEAERLVRRALEFRHGETVLPIETERDLESWFGAGTLVDPDTGEVTAGTLDVDGPAEDEDED